MPYTKKLDALLESPFISNALKDTLLKFDDRDCLDAMKDAEVLLNIMKLRVTENMP